MSNDYKVPFTTILDIKPHQGADRLSVATIYGFQVIVSKDKYKIGDKIVYIPVDSILTDNIEKILFPEGSKIKLNNHRIRQIRIRKLASQGMAVDPKDLSSIVNLNKVPLETDLSEILNIKKYEPAYVGSSQTLGLGKNRNKKTEHSLFHKYNGLDNIKWMPDLFKTVEEVVIQEKLHGTSARASILPYEANTLWKKVKSFLRLTPKTQNCYGSNNVDISSKTDFTGFYGEDIYGACFKSMDVFSKLKLGEIVYGEIIGPGIQKNYSYGLDSHHFVVFDVKTMQSDGKFKWMNPEQVEQFCKDRGFEHVPILYDGPYNRELTYSLTLGPSIYDPKTKVREGVVIKAKQNYSINGNKKALKWVSELYLDDTSNTDDH